MKLSRMPAVYGLEAVVLGQLEAARARLEDLPAKQCRDGLEPAELPSFDRRGADDRVLARIDQDGFAFAEDRLDAPMFEHRRDENPRLRYGVHIVLRRGRVCVRKQFRPRPLAEGAGDWLWSRLGLGFAREVAALLRLRNLPFVPTLREIDLVRRTIYLDWVRGQPLTHELADAGEILHVLDLRRDAELRLLDDAGRDRREAAIARRRLDRATKARIAAMIAAMNEHGVVPLDIKLGNIVRGTRSGALYWIDFERSHVGFWPAFERPQWEHRVAQQHRELKAWFGDEPSAG